MCKYIYLDLGIVNQNIDPLGFFEVMPTSPFKLLIKFLTIANPRPLPLLSEALAEAVTSIVINEFSVPWVRLRISKPGALRGSKDVGVIIERGLKK